MCVTFQRRRKIMDIDQEFQLLLGPQQQTINGDKSSGNSNPATQRALKQALESMAHLANHLPTGTVLAFQILSPIFTNQGNCSTASSQTLTLLLLAFCGLSCFVLSFTDSVHDESRDLRYGIATFHGFWMVDGLDPLPKEMAAKYKIVPVDFVHGVTAVMVFAAIALLDRNVSSCFYPILSEEMKQMLGMLPAGIGVLGSMLFVNFPTTRHGIGFPLSTQL